MAHIVFLDSATLPAPIRASADTEHWTCRPVTAAHEIVEALADADIAVTNKVSLDAEALRQLPALRYICIAASGYDVVDLAYCRDAGIQVSNVPGYAAASVAEHVIACIFALRRRLVEYGQVAQSGAWSASAQFCVHRAPIRELRGATLGIIGAGAIGQEVARLARALGMQVRFSEHKGRHDVRDGYTAFDDVVRDSDVLSLHCPATPQTRGMIGERELALMRPGALLINTARGALVDERALETALVTERLGGAALDVLQIEPPHAQHRFVSRTLDNLLLTPHIAWASSAAVDTLAAAIAANVSSFLSGRTLNRIA